MKLFSQIPDVVKIGIWGPPRSGKTTYLIMLQFSDCNGWKIKPRGEQTQTLYLY